MGKIKAERLALWDKIIESMQERDAFYVTEIAKDLGITYDKARCNIDALTGKRIVFLEKLPDKRKRLVKVDEIMMEYYRKNRYNISRCDSFGLIVWNNKQAKVIFNV